jgi:sugar lactone lactonase YvrE
MKYALLLVAFFTLMPACRNSGPGETASAPDAKATWSLNEIWRTDTLLTTCESVLYDPSGKQLFVSCINGAPTEKNGLGFIALLQPDGSIKEHKWLTGLNAPKGLGLHGNTLYVTDIDQLVLIDIRNAEILERLDIEGASFLNDVAIGADGKVYFSDSDTGYIWVYSDGMLSAWITEGLQRPNGLFVEEDRVLLTSSGSEDLKVIDLSSGSMETVSTGIGHGDGIAYTGTEGYYITTSWSGEIFLIYPDYSKISLLKTSDQEINSADIGFNLSEQVIYVPTFFDNRVVAYKLEKSQ